MPKCWFVLYDTREEFDIINKFYDKGWAYVTFKNTNGYHNNGDNQIHHNNWVGGSGSTKEELLKNGYIQITFEQFQKYVLKEKEMVENPTKENYDKFVASREKAIEAQNKLYQITNTGVVS